MAKKVMEKFKEGISIQEMENFARKYTTEVFTVLALVIGAISSMYDFFTGPKLTISFLALGVIIGIFLSIPTEKGLRQFYHFAYKQEKMTQMVLGFVHIVVALFIPFILFGGVGLLAGTSYHYYIRQAQIASANRPSQNEPDSDSDEHD